VKVDTREGRRATTATRTEPVPAVPEPPAMVTRPPAVPDRTPRKPAISVPRPAREDAVATSSDGSALPSDDPTQYADWLSHLPRAQQKRIAKLCRANPLSYLAECGGIGPLHIPLPPHISLVNKPSDETRRSRFLSRKDWHQALTPAQARYVERECPGGEDQPSSDLCGESTPLVVAFENQPVRFTRGGRFAFQPGDPVESDWPTAKTPWIASDLDHDASIASGAELFGSSTVLPDGTTARNGFVALAALDANHDGRIDAGDPAFTSLLLWADRDGDRRSAPDELTALSSVIVSISVEDHVEVRCDARRNCERERAALQWRDARGGRHEGSVVDVYLPRR
jgi:hypothetical protein